MLPDPKVILPGSNVPGKPSRWTLPLIREALQSGTEDQKLWATNELIRHHPAEVRRELLGY
jgi:hypothetical protein